MSSHQKYHMAIFPSLIMAGDMEGKLRDFFLLYRIDLFNRGHSYALDYN